MLRAESGAHELLPFLQRLSNQASRSVEGLKKAAGFSRAWVARMPDTWLDKSVANMTANITRVQNGNFNTP
tara:strand:- start:164 stop:376 length:213 start_codon:yes stop_codon:yes gene_type:complete